MRALTVRQPYAWAIMHGQKDVENRSRNIAGSYRGPVAITAAVRRDDEAPAFLVGQWHDWWWDSDLAPGEDFGAILGVVDLVDVHHSSGVDVSSDDDPEIPWAQSFVSCSPWAQEYAYHLVLANPRPLPTPIPIRGRLGLWTLPDDVAAQVEEALR